MASNNTVTFIGNLTADPELRFTKDNKPFATFSIASTPQFFDREANEWADGETVFLNGSAFGPQAENLVESLTKGDRVIATGSLIASKGEDSEGVERTWINLSVQEIGASLLFAEVKATKSSVKKAPAKKSARR